MLKDLNYITILGWMTTKLKLKGVALITYAIIYSFSRDDSSYFQGSLQYLQDWSNSTRQGVTNSINQLIDSKLIIKEEGFPYNKYKINKESLSKLCIEECKQNLQQNDIDSKLSLHNINNNTNNNYIINNEFQDKIDEIINYLNKICGTHFRSNTNNVKKTIKARLKEGYKFDDFKDVIDYKYKEWGENPTTFSNGQLSSTYLRPSTLFGNKFDEYLQGAWTAEFNKTHSKKVESVEKLEERSDLKF